MSILADIESFFRPLFKVATETTAQQKAEYLDTKAAAAGERLDWRGSVVDLLKLMGMDSSLAARAKLAHELGHPGEFTGTAEQNTWLHDKLLDNLKLGKGVYR